jgi:amidohydrolase
MKILPEIESMKKMLVDIRRDIHAHPELAYEEKRTAGVVERLLREWGLEVDRGLATTGVVGTLRNGHGPTIGLRADMDALPMTESNTFEYRSTIEGRMHACGHDGHTAMLLGAAHYLSSRIEQPGTIHFIFQPAEEAALGAKVMIDEGLFERFPVDAVFGMHNWPGLEVGRFAMRAGPMMASFDTFDATVQGVGAHGALPHHGIDPIVVSAAIVSALQTVVSRSVDPLRSAVVSVTKISAGDAYNIIPDMARLSGGIRCFDAGIREMVLRRVRAIVESIAASFGASASIEFRAIAPALLNEVENTRFAAGVARRIVGDDGVDSQAEPVLGSEDFAFMLETVPGCFVFIGNGSGKGGCMIHNPGYDFNDEILTLGATYWVRLAETFLAERAG